jgi:hypothetical protein
MHQITLIKIHADTKSDAQSEVESVLEDSVREGNNAGWDYVAEVVHVNKTILKRDKTTYEDCERSFRDSLIGNMKQNAESIQYEIIRILMMKHLTVKEKELCGDEFTQACDRHKSDVVMPGCFTDLVSCIERVVTDDSGHHLTWLMNKQECNIESVEILKKGAVETGSYEIGQLLGNSDVHFVEIKNPGEKTYYFLCDRHL